MSSARSSWIWPANLLVPGAGLVLAGRPWAGLIAGTLFSTILAAALTAVWVVPGEVPATWKGLLIGFAGGTYVGAQIRQVRALRERARQALERGRKACLRDAIAAMHAQEPERAVALLEPAVTARPGDLLLLVRLAQALDAAGQQTEASAMWEQVRALDRHRVFRSDVRRARGDSGPV